MAILETDGSRLVLEPTSIRLEVRIGDQWVPAMESDPLWQVEGDFESEILRIRETRLSDGKAALEGGSDNGQWLFRAGITAVGKRAKRFEFQVTITNNGPAKEASFSTFWRVPDTGAPRWMVPAMFYKDNRPASCVRRYPRYAPEGGNPEEFVSNTWTFRSDRSSCPSVFAWTDNLSAMVQTDERFSHWMSALGFRGDAEKTELQLHFPYREEPVKYSFCTEDGIAPSRMRCRLRPGEEFSLRFSIAAGPRDLHFYDPIVRDLYEESTDETAPWMSGQEANELLAYGLYNWHFDPEKSVLYETTAFDRYFAKNARMVDRPHMHVAWVSGAPYAYILRRYGITVNNEDYAKAGLAVLDKIAKEGIAPCGTFWPEWTAENGWGTGWNPKPNWVQARTVSECAWFYLQALDYETYIRDMEGHPMSAPALSVMTWTDAIRSNLDFACKIQREDGNFGSYYDIQTGEVQEWDGAGGLMWIPALVAGAAANCFNAPHYLEAAKRAGDYYARFVEDEYIYGAPEDVHLTPTSEDGYNAVIAYVRLYEATKEDKYLQLAKKAADWTMTFRWTYNTLFPAETILHQYDFRTKGADLASPSNNHLHNYGLICHRELSRLSEITGDDYYRRRALDHLQCFHQFIARKDGDFNARKGQITEQWFHTDWTHAKGSMLQLAHCWCAGFVIFANLLEEARKPTRKSDIPE